LFPARAAGRVDAVSTSGADLITAWASVAAAVGTVGAFAIGGIVVYRERRAELEARLMFVDAAGVEWTRTLNGDLVRGHQHPARLRLRTRDRVGQ
jgi:hypothetical protein